MVGEIAFGYVAKKLLDHIADEVVSSASSASLGKLRNWLGRDRQRLACELALAEAARRFAELHRDWYDAFFDETFLAGPAAPLLARCLTRAESVSAEELARAWAQRSIGGRTGERHRDALEGVAEDFVRIWNDELGRQPALREIMNSRVAEGTAAAVEQLSQRTESDSAEIDRLRQELLQAFESLERHLIHSRYPQLADFVDWPSRERVRRAVDLMPRPWVFEALDRFTEQFSSGYLFIVGEAGLGKTALAAAIAADRAATAFFFSESEWSVRPDHCLRHLCVELIERFDLPDKHLPDHAGDDTGTLSRLLSEAASRGQPVWVVIDALDEAEFSARRVSGMPLPGELPPGAFLVMTHRPGHFATLPTPLPRGTGERTLRLRPSDHQQHADVAEFIGREVSTPEVLAALDAIEPRTTAAELARRLTAASEANFMYVSLVLRHIADRREPPIPLDALPAGLDGYYELMWKHISRPAESDWSTWERLRLPVIEHLAVAAEPVSSRWIADHTGCSEDEVKRRALDPWDRFLRRDEAPGETRWRVVHQSFRDFLVARDELSPPRVHARIAAYYSSRESWSEHAEYASRHLTSHLRAAGATEGLFELVERPEWRLAQLVADPTGTAFLNDVDTAWTVAADIDATAAARGERRPELLRELSFALTVVAVYQRSAVFPGELLERGLVTGRLRMDQVLAAARLNPVARQRADLLATIAPLAPRSTLVEILKEAEAIADVLARLRVLSVVITRLAPVERDRVLTRAWSYATETTSEDDRARALELLAPVMDERLARAAERLAQTFKSPAARGHALAALPPPMDPRRRYARVEELLAVAALPPPMDPGRRHAWVEQLLAPSAMPDLPRLRTAILTAAARQAVPSQVRRVAHLARGLRDGELRARVVCACLPRLHGAARDQHVQSLRETSLRDGSPWRRAEVLALLAPSLSADEIAATATVILEAAERSSRVMRRAETLRLLWPFLPLPAGEKALSSLLQAIARTPRPAVRALAMAEVAGFVGQSDVREATLLATSESAGVDGAAVLAKLAPNLPKDLVQLALGRSTRLAPGARMRLLIEILPYLEDEDLKNAVSEVLADCREAPDLRTRLGGLDRLAPFLTVEERRRLMAETLAGVEPTRGTSSMRDATMLIAHLSPEPWTDLCDLAGRLSSRDARTVLFHQAAQLFDHAPPQELALRLARDRDLSPRAAALLTVRLARFSEDDAAAFVGRLASNAQAEVLRELQEGLAAGDPRTDRSPISRQETRRVAYAIAGRLGVEGVDPAILRLMLRGLPDAIFGVAVTRVLERSPPAEVRETLELLSERVEAVDFEAMTAPLLDRTETLDLSLALTLARRLPEPRARAVVQRTLDAIPSADPDHWARACLALNDEGLPNWLTDLALNHVRDAVAKVHLLGTSHRYVDPALAHEALGIAREARHSLMGPYALQKLALHIPARLLGDALEVAVELFERADTEAGEAALGALGLRLRGHDLDPALKRLELRGDEPTRRRFLEALLPNLRRDASVHAFRAAVEWRLPGNEVAQWVMGPLPPPQVLLLLNELADATEHVDLLAAVAHKLEASVVDAFLARIAERPKSRERDAALGVLADSASPEGVKKVLELVADDHIAADVIAARAKDMPDEIVAESFDRIDGMSAPGPTAMAVSALVPRLPYSMLGRALEIAHALPNPDSQARVLVALAPRLDRAMLSRALGLTASLSDPLTHAKALAALAKPARRHGRCLHREAANVLRDAASRGDAVLASATALLGPLLSTWSPAREALR